MQEKFKLQTKRGMDQLLSYQDNMVKMREKEIEERDKQKCRTDMLRENMCQAKQETDAKVAQSKFDWVEKRKAIKSRTKRLEEDQRFRAKQLCIKEDMMGDDHADEKAKIKAYEETRRGFRRARTLARKEDIRQRKAEKTRARDQLATVRAKATAGQLQAGHDAKREKTERAAAYHDQRLRAMNSVILFRMQLRREKFAKRAVEVEERARAHEAAVAAGLAEKAAIMEARLEQTRENRGEVQRLRELRDYQMREAAEMVEEHIEDWADRKSAYWAARKEWRERQHDAVLDNADEIEEQQLERDEQVVHRQEMAACGAAELRSQLRRLGGGGFAPKYADMTRGSDGDKTEQGDFGYLDEEGGGSVVDERERQLDQMSSLGLGSGGDSQLEKGGYDDPVGFAPPFCGSSAGSMSCGGNGGGGDGSPGRSSNAPLGVTATLSAAPAPKFKVGNMKTEVDEVAEYQRYFPNDHNAFGRWLQPREDDSYFFAANTPAECKRSIASSSKRRAKAEGHRHITGANGPAGPETTAKVEAIVQRWLQRSAKGYEEEEGHSSVWTDKLSAVGDGRGSNWGWGRLEVSKKIRRGWGPGEWEVVKTDADPKNGWSYAGYYPPSTFYDRKPPSAMVRRRIWRRVNQEEPKSALQQVAVMWQEMQLKLQVVLTAEWKAEEARKALMAHVTVRYAAGKVVRINVA